ncbi:hypothetical protein MMC24_007669 [Lignoscripta atroalba]|nr:hypothetical protein [Lignoscripta atroalba]
MESEYVTYLGVNVLNEGKIVSGGLFPQNVADLAPAGDISDLEQKLESPQQCRQKVASYGMLFDFHKQQTSKKAGSVHATYLVSGLRQTPQPTEMNDSHRNEGEDAHIQSSPFMSSSTPHEEQEGEPPSLSVVTLAREEDLEVVKAGYRNIRSVHIYSLELNSVQNLQTLSDCTREIYLNCANEDPLVAGKQYGMIQNPRVKRRTGPRPSITSTLPTAASKAFIQPAVKNTTTAIESPKDSTGASPEEANLQLKNERPRVIAATSSSKPPRVKREQSDIFKSFSKPQVKLSRENTDSSVGPSAAPTNPQSEQPNTQEDEPMKDASEDEQLVDFVVASKKDTAQNKKSKTEREEQLRKLMDDEDEPMDTTPDEPLDQFGDSKPIDALNSHEESPAESPLVVSGGRRRGRRKVMKKKMLKDDEGYLVTKEEPAWESFSEDETPLQKAKTPISTAPPMAKGKKPGGKPGQGNIMSFFGKK